MIKLYLPIHAMPDVHRIVLDAFADFLKEHKEGAIVTLVLMATAGGERWRVNKRALLRSGPYPIGEWRYLTDEERSFIERAKRPVETQMWRPQCKDMRYTTSEYEFYPHAYSMLNVPGVESWQPLDVLLALEKLSKLLSSVDLKPVFAKHYWIGHEGEPQAYRYRWFHPPIKFERINVYDIPKMVDALPDPSKQRSARLRYDLDDRYDCVLVDNSCGARYFVKENMESRQDVRVLQTLLGKRADLRRALAAISNHNEQIITYLQCRACDIACYDKRVADLTFPDPPISGATRAQVADVVDGMVRAFQEWERQNQVEEDVLALAEQSARAGKELVTLESQLQKTLTIPDELDAKVLGAEEIKLVKEACWKEFQREPLIKAVLIVLSDFARFCQLLSQPENHLKARTGQYVEMEENERTYNDMAGESAWELMRLPQYRAYAKIIQEVAGEKKVWSGIVRTLPPPSSDEGMKFNAEQEAINLGYKLYCRARNKVDHETRQRQEQWLDTMRALPPPQRARIEKEPPPTSY